MITEDYVSLEVAKLLKEKGFIVETERFYDDNGIFCDGSVMWNWNVSIRRFSAPTLQIAMKWLREIYKCWIVVYPEATDDSSAGCLWGLEISFRSIHHQYTFKKLYESYEEACEAAIKYCLEKLI